MHLVSILSGPSWSPCKQRIIFLYLANFSLVNNITTVILSVIHNHRNPLKIDINSCNCICVCRNDVSKWLLKELVLS